MSSQKKEINFNEYWEFFKSEASSRNWTDSLFMSTCKVPRQRYYEFGKSRSLTGTYMVRIMEGMGLTQETIEKKTGNRFTPEQMQVLRRESWVAAHEDLVDGLVAHPELIPLIQQQTELYRKIKCGLTSESLSLYSALENKRIDICRVSSRIPGVVRHKGGA